MQYLDIKTDLKDFITISTNDILKIDSDFHIQRLSEWQKKGYIKKISKGFYMFSDLEVNESVLFIVANRILDPSYISLEMALSYYGLIPESVYAITSVTSKKSYRIVSPVGSFAYRQIKAGLMFGYKLVKYDNHVFKIAEIEKAFLDYLYVNPKLDNEGAFEELRVNQEVFREKIDLKKMNRYLDAFNNRSLEKRVNKFIKFITHA